MERARVLGLRNRRFRGARAARRVSDEPVYQYYHRRRSQVSGPFGNWDAVPSPVDPSSSNVDRSAVDGDPVGHAPGAG